MTLHRGDVVLIPFPFTDLSASKTRPAIVVSGDAFHSIRSELLLAYVSSQVFKADPTLDHVLVDWKDAGLLKPSFVRPKLAAIEPDLIVHSIGHLSEFDLRATDRILLKSMGLAETASPHETPILSPAEAIRTTDSRLAIDLADGRTISIPIDWYPRLEGGTPAERINYQISGSGQGIHWQDLDEDISVEGIILGRKSMESPASLQRWLARRLG